MTDPADEAVARDCSLACSICEADHAPTCPCGAEAILKALRAAHRAGLQAGRKEEREANCRAFCIYCAGQGKENWSVAIRNKRGDWKHREMHGSEVMCDAHAIRARTGAEEG